MATGCKHVSWVLGSNPELARLTNPNSDFGVGEDCGLPAEGKMGRRVQGPGGERAAGLMQ